MAKRNNNESNKVYGLNVYEDKKGRIIYYDMFKKQGLYIPTFDYKQFSIYKMRYIIDLSAFVILQALLTQFFEVNFLVPCVLTVFVFLFFEYKFRKFLSTKSVVKHFKKEECKGYFDIISGEDKNKLLIKGVLYILLGVLLVFNGYDRAYTGFTMMFCWLVMVLCLGASVLQFMAYAKSKK